MCSPGGEAPCRQTQQTLAILGDANARSSPRAGDDSPLRTTFRRDVLETCHFQWLPTPRRRRFGPNGTSPTQSRPSIAQWWSQSPGCCRAAHAAPADFNETCDKIYDAVVLNFPSPPGPFTNQRQCESYFAKQK